MIYRVLRPIRQNAIEADEVSAGEILNELINLNKGSESIKDALVGEGDASLSTQMGKLRNDFRDFAEKVSEDGSKALIEALEEVIFTLCFAMLLVTIIILIFLRNIKSHALLF